VLYGKRELLDSMPPYQGGGEMIREVTFAKTTYNDIPFKFEAGTPNIGDVIAFKYALDFVNELGKPDMAAHEDELLHHFVNGAKVIPGITLVGTAAQKISVQSFVLNNMHHFDAGMMLDAKGIAVRTGHHCTQPLMQRFGLDGTVRASFAVYNTLEEVDVLLEVLSKLSQ
jgi:cysteine desulfurase/selenocysteine lyase